LKNKKKKFGGCLLLELCVQPSFSILRAPGQVAIHQWPLDWVDQQFTWPPRQCQSSVFTGQHVRHFSFSSARQPFYPWNTNNWTRLGTFSWFFLWSKQIYFSDNTDKRDREFLDSIGRKKKNLYKKATNDDLSLNIWLECGRWWLRCVCLVCRYVPTWMFSQLEHDKVTRRTPTLKKSHLIFWWFLAKIPPSKKTKTRRSVG
jgi:hypothetical protein